MSARRQSLGLPEQTPVVIGGVWLRREGSDAVVLVERNGKWTEVIREHAEDSFSHIVEPNGIRERCDR